MKDYYKNFESNKLFKNWLSNSPESYHQLDMNRFYEFVQNLFINEEELNETTLSRALHEEKKWSDKNIEEFVIDYMEKYFLLKDFWSYTSK